MKPRRTPESNFVFRLPSGNEDNDLWVELDPEAETISSTWVLTEEERRQVLGGANVELLVWSKNHPPVALRITDRQPGRTRSGSNGG